MRRFFRLCNVATLLWCLTGIAWAAPRVAIVTPVAGSVWLGEDLLTAPRIAEEGQKLLVDGEVRLQLLGSSKECVITGNRLFIISKANLEKEGKIVSRGSIAVAGEIGNIHNSASANARDQGVKMNYVVGFALDLPPKQVGTDWQASVVTRPQDFPKTGVVVTLTEMPNSKPLMELAIKEPTDHLTFEAGTLKPGHRYEVHVQGPASGYFRQFQVLSSDERAELTKTASVMRVEALKSEEIAILLRLANFYSSFDETKKVAEVLTEVVNQPSYTDLDEASKEKIEDALNLTLRSLDRKNYDSP